MLVALLAGGLLVAIHRPASGPPPAVAEARPTLAPGVQRYEVEALVLERGTEGARLCVKSVLLPLDAVPACSGPSITNWEWDRVDGQRSGGGARWGTYAVTATYRDRRVTLAETPTPVSKPRAAEDHDRFVPPCPEPKGGWARVGRPGSNSPATAEARARTQPDFAGSWRYDIPTDRRTDGGPSVVAIVAFTGNLDRHRRDLQAVWGGPLCVIARSHTRAELRSVADTLPRAPDGLDVDGVGVDDVTGAIQLTVVAVPTGAERRLVERYGVPFHLEGLMRPVS
ncbi:hypothetical protein BH10ACT1_BH10ACT1_21160 [soil metagenome]